MPKLPKFSDFTDVSSLMNKVKSAIENITGPSSSAATEEALAQEKDPIKAQLLEVELLINQLHEMMVIQNKTINDLESKYGAVKKLAMSVLLTKAETKAAVESVLDTPISTIKDEPPKE